MELLRLQELFTFQSGSILMHCIDKIIGIKKIFTFQSGSILIYIYSKIITNLLYFTFQSGSILIKPYSKYPCKPSYLYIPIWFYSNIYIFFIGFFICDLYIPIWFYSNGLRVRIRPLLLYFTFQSGSILIRTYPYF